MKREKKAHAPSARVHVRREIFLCYRRQEKGERDSGRRFGLKLATLFQFC